MDFVQAIMWIIGGAVVFVVIRMLWLSMFRSSEIVSPLPPLGSATSTGAIEPADDDQADGIWIEIDIEPLFPSSERSVIDLTSEQEPESRS